MRRLLAMAAVTSASCLALSGAVSTNTVPAGGTYVLSGTSENRVVIAGAGSTLQAPSNCVVYEHVVVSGGVVKVVGPSGHIRETMVRFVSGLKSVDGGSLCIDGPSFSVDRVSWSSSIIPSTGPLFDIGVATFLNDSGDSITGECHVRNKSTIWQLPTNSLCNVVVESSASEIVLGCPDESGALPLLVDNTLALTNFNVTALTPTALPEGCKVKVSSGHRFTFMPAEFSEDGYSWIGADDRTGAYGIELEGRGAEVRFANYGRNACRSRAVVTGVGEMLFWPWGTGGETVADTFHQGYTYHASYESPITNHVDTTKAATGWRSKVLHRFDASDSSSIVPFSFDANTAFGWTGEKNEFDGNQIVIGWKDSESDLVLYNNRTWLAWDGDNPMAMTNDFNLQIMPYLVKGGLNGLDYMSFGTCDRTLGMTAGATYDSAGNPASAYENRRLILWNGDAPGDSRPSSGSYDYFKAEYCVMVFGSQNGGGFAVMGTLTNEHDNANTNLPRLPEGTTAAGTLSRDSWSNTVPWMASENYAMHVGGLVETPTSDTPNGGWQIVSIDMTGTNTYFLGLGLNNAPMRCGGQNYAEIIFFSEKPTQTELSECEEYLAGKWGLYGEYVSSRLKLSGAGWIYLCDTNNVDEATGGNIEEAEILGSYRGNVRVPLKTTLALNLPLPPSEGVDVLGEDDFAVLTNATVWGYGNVKSATFRNLPKFSETYSGSLVDGSSLSFSIDKAVCATEAVDAVKGLHVPVVLDDAASITLTGAKPGRYVLLSTSSSVSGGGNMTVDVVGSSRVAVPEIDGGNLSVVVYPAGLGVFYQ